MLINKMYFVKILLRRINAHDMAFVGRISDEADARS